MNIFTLYHDILYARLSTISKALICLALLLVNAAQRIFNIVSKTQYRFLTRNTVHYFIGRGGKIFFVFLFLWMMVPVRSLAAITVTAPPPVIVYACGGTFPTAYNPLGSIVIKENANGDFANGTNVTLVLTAPANFEFRAGFGSVTFTAGNNITAASVVVTATTISITYTVSGTNKSDVMTISNIQVRGVNTTSSGNILRTAGNPGTGTFAGITNGITNFGTLTSSTQNPTNILTSDPSTANQNACIGSPIINITYSIGGSATGATVSGLPGGVTGSYSSQGFTISGTPTASGTFNYTVNTSGGTCGTASATGTIFVTLAINPGNVNAVRAGGRCGVNIVGDDMTSTQCPQPIYAWYTQSQGNPNGPRTLIPDSTRKDLFPVIEDAGRFRFSRTVTCGSCTSDYAGTNSPLSSYMGVDITSFSSSCAGSNNGSATATITGGTPPYIYTWFKDGIQYYVSPVTTSTTNTITNLGPGSYYVIIGDQADQVGGPRCQATSLTVVIAQNDVSQGLIAADQTICSGANAAALDGTATGTGALTYQWQYSTDNGTTWNNGATTKAFTPTGLTITTQYRRIVTSTLNGTPCSTITSNVVTITMKPLPIATATPSALTICSGAAPAIALTSTLTGTTFTWTAAILTLPTGGTITGFSDCSSACGTTIVQTLTNTGITAGVVRYTVTPKANGCSGTSFTVDVTVNPKSAITAMTTTVCSAAAFTVTPVNITDGIVPAGTTYSWSAPSVAGFTGGAAGSNASSISGTLTNTTNAAVTATYTVTPTSGTCAGSAFTVTVTVNPKPVINAMTTTICSRAAFTVTPIHGTDGIVPSGTTYSWSAPSGTGFTGGSAGSGASNISGTLTNTTNAAVTATYTVIPTSGSCTGSSFTMTVTVNSLPAININSSSNVCVGSTTQWSASGTPDSSSPWNSGTPGFATIDNTGLITGIAAGTSVITYKDINGCSITKNITVYGLIPVTSPTDKSGCSGGQAKFTATYTYNGQVHYQWYISHDGGITWNIISGANGNPITQTPIQLTLNNIGQNGIDIDQTKYRVIITPSYNNGCDVTSAPATLTVYPLPNTSLIYHQ